MSPGRPPPPSAKKTVGQPHALDQLEEAVLLAVAEGALGAGEDGVVVGEHGAGARLAEELAVDPGGAADQAVGRRLRDQVLDLAAAALGGDREAAVLDEGAGIDEVGDVLARGAAAGRVAALDRLGARLVVGQRRRSSTSTRSGRSRSSLLRFSSGTRACSRTASSRSSGRTRLERSTLPM